jgi:hypothetical protein
MPRLPTQILQWNLLVKKLESAGEELAALTKIGPDQSSLFGGDISG